MPDPSMPNMSNLAMPGSSAGAPSVSSPLQPLSALATELEARGLAAAIDASVSVVDAYLPSTPEDGSSPVLPSRRYRQHSRQRVILRPDPVTAHPWWWLLWPGERFEMESTEPELSRLLPVERLAETARRVRNILILDSTETADRTNSPE